MNTLITQEEQSALLRDAREAIAARLEQRPPEYERSEALQAAAEAGTSALVRPFGAFVTLREGKNLRGCIGRMAASEPLEKTIRTMAQEAAFGDPRFRKLRQEELNRCTIEISVLSPMELCPDPQTVTVGVHGLYLIYGGRAGVLLPQVPAEQGWDRDQYLDYICVKAGVPGGSYRQPGAELYTFTAAVFGEE
ncbi:AmmeMemoRadiSam system protein A [Breznakiella homolactica]|uniref:AmmeMemoRadiSam system protein A n=1 Tax=Breznakiella homolactica TaxID=2798577 RepID=A0A7T7XR71_9SPIR|nr:AmmeMemoRadiSam system protein A [Breznakiella homolactica]QQO10903.1 AmmeMemoRadiSam system protein A [Breznakiella homolactica]